MKRFSAQPEIDAVAKFRVRCPGDKSSEARPKWESERSGLSGEYINKYKNLLKCTYPLIPFLIPFYPLIPFVVGKPFLKGNDRFDRLYTHSASITLSGAVSGMIALDFATSVALSVATAFAGDTFTSVDEACADALAEIVNVVAGVAKKTIPGGQVSLSIAHLIRTFKVNYPPGVAIIVIPFDTNKGRLVMEVALLPMEVVTPTLANAA